MQSEWHHLIAHPGVEFVPRELGLLFAPILGRTAVDEAVRLRYCGGWLQRDSDEETVAALAAATRSAGLATTAFATETPIAPTAIDRVVSVALDGDQMLLETPLTTVECTPREVLALDLGVVGEVLPAKDQKQREMHRWVEGALLGLSFPAVRASLLDCGLGRPILQAHLVLPGRRAFLRIERGTRFPTLRAEGGSQALDNWLLFFDWLLGAVPPERVLPEVAPFWRDGTIEPILWHRVEERESRASWLRSWVDLEHGESQPFEDPLPEIDPDPTD